jgi:hypothetical protein
VSVVNVSDVSPALFTTGAIFLLLIGSLFSLGVLSFFQQRPKRGIRLLILGALTLAVMIFVMDRWFAEG